jgi:hypothetical protein
MLDIQRIQFIAANYSNLQGLRALPVSLCLFLIAVWANQQGASSRDLSLPILAFAGSVILFWLVDRYYKKTFGRVQPSRKSKVLEVAFSIIFGVLALGAFWLDTLSLLPISLIGLVFAFGLLADYLRMTWTVKGRYLPYYPVFPFLILIASLLPLLGLDGWWLAIGVQDQLLGVLLICSIVLGLSGFISHLYLIRTLPIEVSDGRSV